MGFAEVRHEFVAVGDSLAAGFQNFSLLGAQQERSFAHLISVQAGNPMTLPLIKSPGFPIRLAIKQRATPRSSLQSFIDCTTAILALPPPGSTTPMAPPVPGSVCEVIPGIPPDLAIPSARDDLTAFPTNLAVPGMTVHEALTKGPGIGMPPSAVDFMATLILGFPKPLGSQVEQAVALNPKNVLLWIGANDVLIAGLSGDFSRLTRLDRFYSSFKSVTDRLAATNARLVIGNIPDVTAIPYFTSAETLAAQSGYSITKVTEKLGINRRDYLRPSAVPIAMDILRGTRETGLPQECPPTVPGLLFELVPCVMKSSQADLLRATVFAYNLVILERTIAQGGTLVDTYSLFNRIKADGYVANKKKLTMDYLGGIFSLDAMHPSNTGHAIIANEWIKSMNKRPGKDIPLLSVDAIAKDELVVR
jgi:hypothetical protein